jgi:hypothetical protein
MNEATIMVLGFLGFLVIASTAVIYSEVSDLEYRVEALEATQGCEPCQLIILTKGN